jgi:hypothetical protein
VSAETRAVFADFGATGVADTTDPWLRAQLAAMRDRVIDPGGDLPRSIADHVDRRVHDARRRARRLLGVAGAGGAAALVVTGAVVRTRRAGA